MGRKPFLWMLICLFAAVISQLSVNASDMTPPDWRGKPGATFQQWLFRFDSTARMDGMSAGCNGDGVNKTPWGQRAPPEYINNPYQQTTGICVEFKTLWPVAQHMDWLKDFNGREGVWILQGENTFANFLNFIVPNEQNGDRRTTIQIQIAYYSLAGIPDIRIQTQSIGSPPDNISPEQDMEHNSISLPDGWVHYSTKFETTGCPRIISVFIYPPDQAELYVDSVAIDTICST